MYAQLNFTSSITTFHFLAEISSLLANSLFWWSIFIKCHMSLSLGDNEEHNRTLFCLYVNSTTDGQWPTGRLWKKKHEWSLVTTNICYVHGDLWTEELAARFVLRAVTQLIRHSNWNLSHDVGWGNWCYLTKMWQQIHAYWNREKQVLSAQRTWYKVHPLKSNRGYPLGRAILFKFFSVIKFSILGMVLNLRWLTPFQGIFEHVWRHFLL